MSTTWILRKPRVVKGPIKVRYTNTTPARQGRKHEALPWETPKSEESQRNWKSPLASVLFGLPCAFDSFCVIWVKDNSSNNMMEQGSATNIQLGGARYSFACFACATATHVVPFCQLRKSGSIEVLRGGYLAVYIGCGTLVWLGPNTRNLPIDKCGKLLVIGHHRHCTYFFQLCLALPAELEVPRVPKAARASLVKRKGQLFQLLVSGCRWLHALGQKSANKY